VLGRDDIGMLAPGCAADIAAFDRRGIDFAGSDWDPLASLVFCGPVKAGYTIINGRVVVAEGQLATMEMDRLLSRHAAMSHDLMQRAGLAS
jgi:cytosine/adenosine deaminase-related metal-dependent hydrolase